MNSNELKQIKEMINAGKVDRATTIRARQILSERGIEISRTAVFMFLNNPAAGSKHAADIIDSYMTAINERIASFGELRSKQSKQLTVEAAKRLAALAQ